MTIKMGLIGCGGHGRQRLSKILRGMGDLVTLVACSDTNIESSKATASEDGYFKAYDNYINMLDKERLDTVVIALPHDQLKSATISGLDAGVHVFVEKPAGVNSNEIIEIIEKEKQSNKTVMVGYCMRYNPGRQRFKEFFRKDVLGEVIQIHGHKSGSQLVSWNGRMEHGGGQLRWHGVHIVDQILWVMGDIMPLNVYSETRWDEQLGSDQDSAFNIMFENGVSASVTVSSRTQQIFDVLDVYGTHGRIRSEWPSEIIEIQSSILPEHENTQRIVPNSPDYMEMYTIQMQDWIDSIMDETRVPIGTKDALKVYKIIDAAYKSSQSGKPINITGLN
ncbi:MAG: Gfo/Idh/MocA family oxidoreductase [SAR202 cluster bacterium]|nr:Gfo/Idh/MocA family oxidoreductase [SAR202 cluster bacterium]|tara:strand:- start:9200 stop:10204 length:1005 start_codon:yes stop_codon:yes gene_type:complete